LQNIAPHLEHSSGFPGLSPGDNDNTWATAYHEVWYIPDWSARP